MTDKSFPQNLFFIFCEVTKIYYYWKVWGANWQVEGSLITLSKSDKLL
jgi:hypothetical protein